MNKKVILAIDAGTTGNRVIAITKGGEIVAKAYYEFSQILPRPGWVEHDPEEIFSTTLNAFKDVAFKVGVENIVAIGITNQRETTIIWDRETGKPIYNAIVWQCRRTKEICQKLKSHEGVLKNKTGLVLDPYFSATKIKWILDNVDGAREKASNGELLFGTPDTWLLWKLTGEKSHLTDPGNASRTLLYNIRTETFDNELLKIFDIPKNMLPEVKDSDSFFGVLDKSILGKEIPIYGILGDQQASLFAHLGWKEGIIKNTYGTGLFVMTDTQKDMPITDKLITTVAWKIEGKLNYALEASIFMGGATLQWLRDNLGIINHASESEEMAVSIEDNEGVYFVPALQGLGAPHWKPSAKGVIIGLTRRASKEAIVRAALEAMAYQTRDAVEEIKKLVSFDMKILSADGGACANNFLMQFQADILDMEVVRPKIIERTALGAAGLCGLSCGFWTKEELNKNLSDIDRTFKPKMSAKIREKYYTEWKTAVKVSLNNA